MKCIQETVLWERKCVLMVAEVSSFQWCPYRGGPSHYNLLLCMCVVECVGRNWRRDMEGRWPSTWAAASTRSSVESWGLLSGRRSPSLEPSKSSNRLNTHSHTHTPFSLSNSLSLSLSLVLCSSNEQCAISCSNRATSGYLYPLDKGFIFVHKPAVYIKFDAIVSVNFARMSGSAGISRSFDFELELRDGNVIHFSSIMKWAQVTLAPPYLASRCLFPHKSTISPLFLTNYYEVFHPFYDAVFFLICTHTLLTERTTLVCLNLSRRKKSESRTATRGR